MPATPTYGLTYPDYAEDPDGPAQIQQLAEDVETALDGKTDVGHAHAISDVTGLTAALDGKSSTGHSHATLPNRKPVHFNVSAEFNSNGVATITHTLGATPIGGHFTAISSALTGNSGVGGFRFISGEATDTTFKLRAFAPDGTPLNQTLIVSCTVF